MIARKQEVVRFKREDNAVLEVDNTLVGV